ncbi:MAG: protein kinase [Myxococcales bacterium]|nr:protein kinase [Myxococcales bacterium]
MSGNRPEEELPQLAAGLLPGPVEGLGELLVILAALLLGGSALWLVLRARSAQPSAPGSREPSIQDLIDHNQYAEAAERRVREGDFEKALALFQHSGNRQKAAECYLRLGQPRRAADLYREDGRTAEAAHHYQEAGAWRDAAECHEGLGQPREAAELFERAGDLSKAALLLRGIADTENAARLFERAGDTAEAAATLLEASGQEPETLRRAGELFCTGDKPRRAGECFAAAGDWQRAAELFEAAGAVTLAAQAYEHASDWDRAAALYEEAEAFPEARTNYERAGDLLRSANIARQIGWLLDAGRGYYKLGSYERAIETLQSIAPGSPEAREATLLLGRIFVEKGLYQRGKEKLEALQDPAAEPKDQLACLSLLAEAYERSGEIPLALGALEQVVQIDESFENAAGRLERLQDQALADTCPPTGIYDSRYELQEEIGRGGMGVVYVAQDKELGRLVAVKFLPPELGADSAALRMFRQEARSAAAMNHPNIVQVYDVGILSGRHCILMEYVSGRTARDLMRKRHPGGKRKRPLEPRKVAEIAHETCTALAYAHAQRIIHRDVKPANIIISDGGQVKLTDFGISKLLEAGGEEQTQAKGTPQYMAPEQLLGRPLDGRADLYALGISMFEMAAGRRPFIGEDLVDQQLHHELPDPRSLNPECPQELVEIIRRACAKQAEERYPTAEAMREALAAFLGKRESSEGCASEPEPPSP